MILDPLEKPIGDGSHRTGLHCPWCRKHRRLGIRYKDGYVDLEPAFQQGDDGKWRRERRARPYMPRGKDIKRLAEADNRRSEPTENTGYVSKRVGRPFYPPGPVGPSGRRSLSLEEQFKNRGKGGSPQELDDLVSRYNVRRDINQDWNTSDARVTLAEGTHTVVCQPGCGIEIRIVVSI